MLDLVAKTLRQAGFAVLDDRDSLLVYLTNRTISAWEISLVLDEEFPEINIKQLPMSNLIEVTL